MEDVKRSLKDMESHFSDQLERRDRVLKESRDVITSSSRAIISVHTGRMKEAERQLEEARELLQSLKEKGEGSAARYLISPETEYVEASAVLSLARGGHIPSRETLGASQEAYLLGLLDTVGELKRLVLDSIMGGNLAKARRYFATMEDLYALCSPLAVYDHVVNGARRKIDVARMLVEDTRGLMTEEARRETVASAMSRLEKRLGRRKS